MQQVYVGGRNDADIGLLHLAGTHLDEFAALQDAQQLGLAGQRQLPDFIQEQGSPVGLLEIPFAGFDGAGERAFFVSEQLGIDGSFRNGPAVDGEILPVLAAAVLVDDLRDVFLAHAALARDKDRQVRGCDSHRRFQGTVQRRVVPDDVEFIFEPL